jgi:CxxC motif-containing protein (DUF1111 family)
MRRSTQRFLVSLVAVVVCLTAPLVGAANRAEAPAGFDDQTNGLTSQTQFDLDRETFEEREDVSDGLGPVYNAQSCAECHQTPVSGSGSQITALRVGRFNGARFTDRPGGSLINDRAIDPAIQERANPEDNVQTFRTSLSALGDGYVEAIPDSAFTGIQSHQPQGMKGFIVRVPVLEAPGTTRIGRFGWKAQQASLISFAADAYLNEMGITSPLAPNENTSNGNSVADFDTVPDPEDAATSDSPFGPDIEAFARFIRSTQAPGRDAELAASPEAQAGAHVFEQIGCANCHTESITTAPAGTVINGGTFTVPAALGNKVIHPYSDFMLHDVGTGDGIVQVGGQETRNKLRTPPLWGLRTHSRLMHDGASLTRDDAIRRHGHEAAPVTRNYNRLPPQEKDQLMAFLASL